MPQWDLANSTGIIAVRDRQGRLIVAATGEKPTPCHEVSIRVRPERILPPMLEIVWRQTGFCQEVMTRYAVHSQPIVFPASATSVRVFTASGEQAVPIHSAPIPIGPAVVTASTDTTEFATGYSSDLRFDEAFADALANLPSCKPRFPDELVRISVTEIGGEFGGIAGLHRMFVTISRETVTG